MPPQPTARAPSPEPRAPSPEPEPEPRAPSPSPEPETPFIFGPNPYLTRRFWRNHYLTRPFCSRKSRFWPKSLLYSAVWAKSLPHSALMNKKLCFVDKPLLYSASSTNARTAVMTWAWVVTNKNSLKIHSTTWTGPKLSKPLVYALDMFKNSQPFIDAS